MSWNAINNNRAERNTALALSSVDVGMHMRLKSRTRDILRYESCDGDSMHGFANLTKAALAAPQQGYYRSPCVDHNPDEDELNDWLSNRFSPASLAKQNQQPYIQKIASRAFREDKFIIDPLVQKY